MGLVSRPDMLNEATMDETSYDPCPGVLGGAAEVIKKWLWDSNHKLGYNPHTHMARNTSYKYL